MKNISKILLSITMSALFVFSSQGKITYAAEIIDVDNEFDELINEDALIEIEESVIENEEDEEALTDDMDNEEQDVSEASDESDVLDESIMPKAESDSDNVVLKDIDFDYFETECTDIGYIDESDVIFDLTTMTEADIDAYVFDVGESVQSETYDYEWDKYSSYYVYNRLNDKQKLLWKAVDKACMEVLTSNKNYSVDAPGFIIKVPNDTFTDVTISEFAEMFRLSNPQYFFLSGNVSTAKYNGGTYLGCKIYKSMIKASDRSEYASKFNAGIEEYMAQISASDNDVDTVKSILEVVCSLTASANGEYSQSAYGVFADKGAQSVGYSLATELLCNACGIDCMTVAAPTHAYNVVKINDSWCNLDSSWADLGARADYREFLKSDIDFNDDSRRALKAFWKAYKPVCTMSSESDGIDYLNPPALPTGKAATPVIKFENGMVDITALDADEIFYTINGDAPSSSHTRSYLYKGSFKCSRTMTVKAVAVKDGYYDSDIAKYDIVLGDFTLIPISKVIVKGNASVPYTGEAVEPDFQLVYKSGNEADNEEKLVEGIDYHKICINNVDAGRNKAVVIYTGMGKFTGDLKKAYTILPYSIKAEDIELSIDDTALSSDDTMPYYNKNLITPDVTVKFGDEVLVAGKDYTVKYSNNRAASIGITAKTPKIPTATIRGKGNYAGTVAKTFGIQRAPLTEMTMMASDINYIKKANMCKPAITIYNQAGNKLSANSDYQVVFTYKYDTEVTCIVNGIETKVTRLAGYTISKDDIIPVDTWICATAYGRGNYDYHVSADFRVIDKTKNISAAKIQVKPQAYTGEAVEPEYGDIKVILGTGDKAVTLTSEDYDIVGYSNNIKKGTGARITLKGKGSFGGTKTVGFSIR